MATTRDFLYCIRKETSSRMLSAGSRRDGQDSLKSLITLGLSEKKVFHRPRDEESANARNLQNILPHTGYGAVNLETRKTVCCRVRHREQEGAMSPLFHRAVSAKCRHQSCKPWFHSNTSTDQAARNSWSKGRSTSRKHRIPCRNSR